MKARVDDRNHLPRTLLVTKIRSVKKMQKKIKQDRHSLMTTLQLTQRELKRVRRKLKEEQVLTESSQKRPWRRDLTKMGRKESKKNSEKPIARDLCAKVHVWLYTGLTRPGTEVCEVRGIRAVI